MARTVAELPSGTRITDFISLGVVTKTFPITTIESVLKETGKASIRKRDLPAQVVIYYVIALAFYMQSSYREVLRCLLEGIKWLLGPEAILSCNQWYINNPMKTCKRRNLVMRFFQERKTINHFILYGIHRIENLVCEIFFPHFFPHMLRRINLCTIRWQQFYPHIFRYLQIFCTMPRCAIHNHEHKFIAVPSSYLINKQGHKRSVYFRQNQRVHDTVMGTNSRISISILSDNLTANYRPDTRRNPAPSSITDPTKASFILKHQANFSALFGLPVYFFANYYRKFFLNSFCFSRSA
jgi:hypothetical protein